MLRLVVSLRPESALSFDLVPVNMHAEDNIYFMCIFLQFIGSS